MGDIALPAMPDADGGAERSSTAACACLWCGRPFTLRTDGGRRRRFCLPLHRTAYYSAARRFVDQLVQQGRLSATVLHAPPATCTLLPGGMPGVVG